jgi:hypothetical protein
MNRFDGFDGTSARQLDLLDAPIAVMPMRGPRRPMMRILRKDIYAELQRRRRRAQIAARHALDAAPKE